MPRDFPATSAELDRDRVVHACEHTLCRIIEERVALYERALSYAMRERRFFGFKRRCRTLEQAKEVIDSYGAEFATGWDLEPYERQKKRVSEILRLARACDRPTLRIDRDDFGMIEAEWPEKAAAARPTPPSDHGAAAPRDGGTGG